MAVAAFLVMITSVVMGSLGTALLHGYLLGRGDQQLRDFAAVASRSLAGGAPRLPQAASRASPSQPFQFLIEIISADGRISVTEAPLHHASLPRIASSRLQDPEGPFTGARRRRSGAFLAGAGPDPARRPARRRRLTAWTT